jgi:hypothetical protein
MLYEEMTYQVKQTPDGKHWIVVDETGFIANDEEHSTKKKAEIHKRNIEAFFVKQPTNGIDRHR